MLRHAVSQAITLWPDGGFRQPARRSAFANPQSQPKTVAILQRRDTHGQKSARFGDIAENVSHGDART